MPVAASEVSGGLDRAGLFVDAPSSVSLWSGQRMDPLNPHFDDFRIDDIAHALARQCRYNGHVTHYLSVARHSVWVSEALDGTGHELWGLLHDAAEAYIGDMVRPLKHHESMAGFTAIESVIERSIADAFDLPWPMPAEVREADRLVGVIEHGGGNPYRWWWNSTPEMDEARFLDRYHEVVA